MLDDDVTFVGEEPVVQIVTDNAANFKAVGEMVMQKEKGRGQHHSHHGCKLFHTCGNEAHILKKKKEKEGSKTNASKSKQ